MKLSIQKCRINPICRGTAVSVLAALLAAPLSQAFAALEEVVVTAQRREQNLQDVPVSITAFSSQSIERNMFKGVDDYFARTPGVSFISTGARDRKDIAIRGVSNFLTVDSISRVSTFGFYIDEFNVSIGTTNPQIMDLERIEVLRGPQGTYFGRNSVGGAVNVTSRSPDASGFYGEGSVDYSSYDTRDIEGILNIPIVADKVALRLNGKYRKSDGNIRNIHPIGGGNTQEYTFGRAALRLTPNDRLTVDLTITDTEEEGGMRQGVPSGVFSAFAGGLYAGVFGDPNLQPSPDGVGFYPENRDRVNFNRPQSVGTKFNTKTGRIVYDFDTFTVTSITGYIESDQELMGDIDGSSLDLFYETKPVARDSLSSELRIHSTAGERVDWTVGGLIGRDRGAADQHTFVGAAMPFGLPENFEITSTIQDSKTETQALFGEVTWHANDRLDVVLGGRYTREKHFLSARNTSSGAVVGDVVEGEESSFNDFSPKLSVSYVFNDEMTGYATVSKGFKSGGVQLGTELSDPSFDSEVLWNYEVGLKTQLWDNRLRLNTALFYMDWTDLQAQFSVGIQEGTTVRFIQGIQNAGSAHSQGFEIELSAALTENLSLNAGIGYVDSEFDDFRNAVAEGASHDLTGRVLPNAPKWTLNADAEYNFTIGDSLDGFARMEWAYRDSVEPSLQSLVNEGFPWDVPSFSTANLRLGIENERFSLVGYVENLFDENYYTNAYQKAFLGGVYVEPSYRRAGVRLTIRTN